MDTGPWTASAATTRLSSIQERYWCRGKARRRRHAICPSRARWLEVIAKINRDLGTTVVVITHNASIEGMADRVLRLSDGRITAVEVNARRLAPSELTWQEYAEHRVAYESHRSQIVAR